ncbi:MAG: hypothetical protein HY925_15365 [Elusimicrobia bacterium]|nr:hypothetical protein [Elusimicrobiota bacterium]
MTPRAVLLLLLLSACAAPKPASQPAPPAPPSPPAAPPNLEVRVSEVIQRADLDGLSYAEVFLDGAPAGRTDVAPRSKEKRWSAALPPKNYAVRLELWLLPGTGEWTRLPDDRQPRERFVRAEAATRAVLLLRRHPSGRYDFDVSKQPL